MSSKSILLLIVFMVTFSLLLDISSAKEMYDSCCCGGSGKYIDRVACPYPNYRTNCGCRHDPAFPFIEYNAPANYLSFSYAIPVIFILLLTAFGVFIVKNMPFSGLVNHFLNKSIIPIKPKIVRTKCKYYSNYWVKEFKRYL